ncbi:MAG: hypothetical protein CMM25_05410 [Rhodospirillaceae bacterium]|nr:hypothetical protein [Rhodospirillaceae bacterium]
MLPMDEEIINKELGIIQYDSLFYYPPFYFNKLCGECLEMYLNSYPINFKQIMNREISFKK